MVGWLVGWWWRERWVGWLVGGWGGAVGAVGAFGAFGALLVVWCAIGALLVVWYTYTYLHLCSQSIAELDHSEPQGVKVTREPRRTPGRDLGPFQMLEH